MRVITYMVLALLCCSSTACAGHVHKEKEYQNAWCRKAGGATEVVLEDATRVDCLTDRYAVEVDFAQKWAEGIGQALYYAEKTGRQPGVLLILEKGDDDRYLERLQTVAYKYNIATWTITPAEIE